MFKSYFHLVSRLLKGSLYCDVSRDEIERYLYQDREFDRVFAVPCMDDDGSQVALPIRLVIQKPDSSRLESMNVALLLHDVRIGCIDWEFRYTDQHGNRQRGWHKHVWDDEQNTADHLKEPLANFETLFVDQTGCLIHIFKEVKITLSGKDYGDPAPSLF